MSLTWAIEYSKSAKDQLRKLDPPVARRILDTMENRIAASDNPREVYR
jgi:mRNA interferase RelE/StbE